VPFDRALRFLNLGLKPPHLGTELLGLRFEPRFWPAIAAGAFFVNFTAAGSALTSLAIAGGNTIEALAAAALIYRFANGTRCFERGRDSARFVMLAGMLSTVVSPLVESRASPRRDTRAGRPTARSGSRGGSATRAEISSSPPSWSSGRPIGTRSTTRAELSRHQAVSIDRGARSLGNFRGRVVRSRDILPRFSLSR
jgi:hypothetical protein